MMLLVCDVPLPATKRPPRPRKTDTSPWGRTLWAAALAAAIIAGIATIAWNHILLAQPIVHGLVAVRYPGQRWITTANLREHLDLREEMRPLLLDTRSEAEFRVSHIPGAQHIAPNASSLHTLDVPADRDVVVYCSVGLRSSEAATQLRESGVERVYNLKGGIFAWANEGHPLARDSGPADRVHPYGAFWGWLLNPERRAVSGGSPVPTR